MRNLDEQLLALVQGIEQLEVERREAVADVYRYSFTDNRTGQYSAAVKTIDAELERKMNLIDMLTRK